MYSKLHRKTARKAKGHLGFLNLPGDCLFQLSSLPGFWGQLCATLFAVALLASPPLTMHKMTPSTHMHPALETQALWSEVGGTQKPR